MRQQEFIELIKKEQKMEAVRHAKNFLSTDDPEHLPIVQQGIALLAFLLDTVLRPFKVCGKISIYCCPTQALKLQI